MFSLYLWPTAQIIDALFMQNASMPTLQIRDLPDEIYQRVTAVAKAEHRSLSQQAVVELKRALDKFHPDRRAAVLERLGASERRLPTRAIPPESLIREDRETR
jgi:antitoxin FitA